jgi:hypothetical protein
VLLTGGMISEGRKLKDLGQLYFKNDKYQKIYSATYSL